MEKLFFEINTHERHNKVTVEEKDDLKSKLRNFAIKKPQGRDGDVLSEGEYIFVSSILCS